MNNILWTKEGVTECGSQSHSIQRTKSMDVVAAAKAAGIHNLILKLEDGYQTRVGGTEKRLSGGQGTLIQLLRLCIPPKPPIIVLDKANSALDPHTELEVLPKVLTLFAHSTIIVITHKPQIIRSARLILCLHDGRIVEQGTHNELMLIKGGFYSGMLDKASLNH